MTAKFYSPGGLARDDSSNIMISDESNAVVRIIYKNGTVSTFAGSPYTGAVSVKDGTAHQDDPRESDGPCIL